MKKNTDINNSSNEIRQSEKSPQYEAMHEVMHLMKIHRCVIENRVKTVGLHKSLHMMLMQISGYDHYPSQKELAENTKISPAAVAASLKKLEAEGYIERKTAENDNRTKVIHLTVRGRDMVKKSAEIFERTDCDAFVGINEAELAEFRRMIGVINNNLNGIYNGKETDI